MNKKDLDCRYLKETYRIAHNIYLDFYNKNN